MLTMLTAAVIFFFTLYVTVGFSTLNRFLPKFGRLNKTTTTRALN